MHLQPLPAAQPLPRCLGQLLLRLRERWEPLHPPLRSWCPSVEGDAFGVQKSWRKADGVSVSPSALSGLWNLMLCFITEEWVPSS